METARAAAASRRAPSVRDFEVLELAVAEGDPLAANNLAVALLRTPAPDGEDRAKSLYAMAAEAGVVAARFNVARRIPNRFGTNPEMVKRRIEWLRANVTEGDVHSMVQMAETLYYINRDAFVQDQTAVKLDLLRRDAESGDPDYISIYGKELGSAPRQADPAEPTLLAEALSGQSRAYAAGDPRGAYEIA